MKLYIDGKELNVKKESTILEAAEANGIYIPHLCSHPELTPYGGCRLCIVEVDGLRGFPTACTTKVNEGMVVRSDNPTIQGMRKEIIQLILSDHPAGCLICGEKEECTDFMSTIRKVGATTGCQWCAKNGDCELQRVVDYLGIDEIIFPVYYQGYEVEKYDPFYDRDYNLCIYCGRCVRICQEHRKSYIISLNQRGKKTTIGPAFNTSHLDAECEFCGACISVCPTGANYEKNRKWSGIPDAYQRSYCPLCGLNCEIQVLTRGNQISGTLPPGDPHQSGGELCVKGRFCLSELSNFPDRLWEPQYRFPEGIGFVTWGDAVAKAANAIKGVDGSRIALYVSPDLTLEEIAAAGKFAKQVLKTRNITTTGMNDRLTAMIALASLFEDNPRVAESEEAETIVSIFLNGNYSYAPVTLAVKRAAEKGSLYYQIGWFRDTTSRFSEKQIIPPPGREKQFFRNMVKYLEKGSGGDNQIRELVKAIKRSPQPLLLIGHQFIDLTDGYDILQSIERILHLTGAKIFVVMPYGNIAGLLSLIYLKQEADIRQMIRREEIDLLYLIGESPFQKRPPVQFVIQQGAFPGPEGLLPDLILPAPSWGEISGSYAGMDMKRQYLKKAVSPAEHVLENGKIFSRIARALSRGDMKYSRQQVSDLIPSELKIHLPTLKTPGNRKHKVLPTGPDHPFLLILEHPVHSFQNIGLSRVSPGMATLLPEETIFINPVDAEKLGVKSGDTVQVRSMGWEGKYPLLVRKLILPGFLFLATSARDSVFETNPCPVHLRRNDV